MSVLHYVDLDDRFDVPKQNKVVAWWRWSSGDQRRRPYNFTNNSCNVRNVYCFACQRSIAMCDRYRLAQELTWNILVSFRDVFEADIGRFFLAVFDLRFLHSVYFLDVGISAIISSCHYLHVNMKFDHIYNQWTPTLLMVCVINTFE